MLEFLIDNIFAMFGGRVFQQTVGIHMGTNCAPLLTDLFLYSYEADFIQGLLKKNEKKLAGSFNFTRIRVVFFLQNKIYLFLAQGFTLAILFYETQLDQLP
jgi:hypothetical protein